MELTINIIKVKNIIDKTTKTLKVKQKPSCLKNIYLFIVL